MRQGFIHLRILAGQIKSQREPKLSEWILQQSFLCRPQVSEPHFEIVVNQIVYRAPRELRIAPTTRSQVNHPRCSHTRWSPRLSSR